MHLRLLLVLLLSSVAHAQVKIIEDEEHAAAASMEVAGQLLYVFGDSYADTGNHEPDDPDAVAWKVPYGSSWPGKPSGRCSDGHVLTEFYASQMSLPPPMNYREFISDWSISSRGINFAYGGSGVFPTTTVDVTVGVQLEHLRGLINVGRVSVDDVANSVALFSINGNDYLSYVLQHLDDWKEHILGFIPNVVNQAAMDLEAASKIGFKNLVVTAVPPLGCLPPFIDPTNENPCNDLVNKFSGVHNFLLELSILILRNKIPDATFSILDLFSAFNTTIKGETMTLGPCCEGDCGGVKEDGTPNYTVCPDPTATLFWDQIHPTDSGWKAIVESALPQSLETHQFPIM